MKKRVLTLFFIQFLTIGFAQKTVRHNTYSYDSLVEGTYVLRSFSVEYLLEKLPIVKPNIQFIQPEKYSYFLNPNKKTVVLFGNHNLEELKPIGKLNNLTQVYLDSIIYKYKYKDYTNCVWNRIIIDNKVYYTDANIHDYSLSKELKNLNQKVLIVGQFDGYDGNYHLGYPENFFLIFIDDKNEVIHKTSILNFYLNDEFAMEEDILNINWNTKSKSYEISLTGSDDQIKINWNGKVSEIKNK